LLMSTGLVLLTGLREQIEYKVAASTGKRIITSSRIDIENAHLCPAADLSFASFFPCP